MSEPIVLTMEQGSPAWLQARLGIATTLFLKAITIK